VPKHQLTFFCVNGHVTALSFAHDAELPQAWDCPRCGVPAGLDALSPPEISHHEPFKSHLAYVKQRRSDADGEALLAESLAKINAQRRPSS